MATVRIYKVAELLGTSSQEVMTLLKRAHAIEVKSASSTIEEVVARQFVERLARERGVALPSSAAMFADTPVVKGRKGGGGRPVEPPKPAQSLPPPRLIKTLRPPAPAVPAEADAEFEATDAEAPAFEPQVPEESPAAAAPSAEVVTEPPSAATPAYAKAPTSEPAVETLPEPSPEVTDAAVGEDISAATQPGEAPSAPVPPSAPPSAPGRLVPPTLRLRVEEPGGARIASRPIPSRPAVPPARPRAQPTQPPPQPRAAMPGPGAAPETRAARPAGAPPAPPQAARPPAAASTTVRIAPPTPPVTRPATSAPTQARTATPTYRPTYTPSVRPSTGHTGQTLIVPPGARPGQTVYRPNQPPGARPVQPAVGRPPQYGRPGGGRRSSSGPRDRDRSGGGIAAPIAPPPVTRTITLAEGMTVKDLADKLDIKAKDVLRKLLEKRMMMTINTTLDTDTATTIAREFGADVQMRTFEEELVEVESENARSEDVVTRAPVVTVMGHVDHGKTTLLDAIRETRVAEREAGGITQHIGAYAVQVNSRNVVFLDTPGHEAFTMMRARGAGVTDVVILVVAADDGVMPQTREAIDHAKAAGVPIIVAINKIDKADSNPDRVKKELADLGLVPEDWGGQTVTVNVSAKKRENLDLLLEMILLVTEIGELKANPKRSASGTVLEAKLDRGRGPVATVLVQDGTLNVGDTVIAGTIVGKVRALIDDRGHPVRQAGPSTPVEVLGLGGLPQPGDTFQSLADAARARQIAVFRQNQAKERALGSRATRLTLESLQKQIAAGETKELPLIIKADVQGSAEVLASSLTKLSDDRVKVRIIHAGVGAINESDALLASASNAIIIGFNVRPDRNAADLAERESVDIRLHSVIYDVTDEMKKAMAGLLEPTVREVRLGSAEVRQTFKVPKFGTVAGCMVTDGRITRSGDSQARLLRDNIVVYEGKLGSLRRFKDDVSEVKTGLECGIAFERFNDIKVGDAIEVFTVERVAATV